MLADGRHRLRIYRLSQEQLLSLLVRRRRPPPEALVLFDIPELPADAEIVSVHHEYQSRSFALTIWSHSFAPVPPNQRVPDMNEPWSIVERVVQLTPAQIAALYPAGEVPDLRSES